MAVSPGQAIAQTALTALAALANAKLAPAVAYAFPALEDLDIPANFTATIANAGSGHYNPTSFTVTLRSYQTIGGVKTYSRAFAQTVVQQPSDGGNFDVQFSWDAAPGADGYLLAMNYNPFYAYAAFYMEVTFETTATTWLDTGHLQTYAANGTPTGTPGWVKDANPSSAVTTLARIKSDLYSKKIFKTTDDGNPLWHSPAALVSGSHVIASGAALSSNRIIFDYISGGVNYYHTELPFTLFKEVEFHFATADVPSGLALQTGFIVASRLWRVSSIALLPYNPFYYQTDTAGILYFNFSMPLVCNSGDGSVAPVVTDFTATVTRADQAGNPLAITPTVSIKPSGGNFDGQFLGSLWEVRVAVAVPLAAMSGGNYESISCTITGGTNWTGTAIYTDGIFVPTGWETTAQTPVTALHPESGCAKIVAYAPTGTLPVFKNPLWNYSGVIYPIGWAVSDQDAVQGVFVAKTLPSPGVNPNLDYCLPDYVKSVDYTAFSSFSNRVVANYTFDPRTDHGYFGNSSAEVPRSSLRMLAPDGSTLPNFTAVTPSLKNQPAVWPVVRDTETYLPQRIFDPFRGTGYKGDEEINFVLPPQQFAYGYIPPRYGLGVRDYLNRVTQSPVNPPLQIYVSQTDYPVPDNHPSDTIIVSSGEIDFTTLAGAFGADWFNRSTFFTTEPNPTTSSLTVKSQAFLEYTYSLPDYQGLGVYPPAFSDRPTFLPGQWLQTIGSQFAEVYSPNQGFVTRLFDADTDTEVQGYAPVPQRGYTIRRVTVRRQPVATGDVALPPTDLPALDVAIGVRHGARYTRFYDLDLGTLAPFQTITIPAGELEASAEVFWPVILATPLVYQCSEPVFVSAFADYQPLFHNRYDAAPHNSPPTPYYHVGVGNLRNFFNAQDYAGVDPNPDAQGGNYYITGMSITHFPIAAFCYNDLETLLNLI